MTASDLPDRATAPTTPGHRDGHTIRLTLTAQTVKVAVVCPFSPEWDAADRRHSTDAPECRRAPNELTPSRFCLVEFAVSDLGVEAIDLPDGEAVPVTTEDIPVSFWWDSSDDFYLQPLPAESRNQRAEAGR